MTTYADVYNAVSADLAGVAPSARGPQGLAENTSPPRYVWLWQGVDPAPSKSLAPSNSRTLGDEVHRALVIIWAKGEDDALIMRRALIGAGRAQLGYQRFTAGSADLVEPSSDGNGIRVALIVSFRLPAIDVFPTPITPVAQPGASPSSVVQSATFPVATVINVTDETPATSTPGDGFIEDTEK